MKKGRHKYINKSVKAQGSRYKVYGIEITDDDNSRVALPAHGVKRQFMVPGGHLMAQSDNSWGSLSTGIGWEGFLTLNGNELNHNRHRA
jgi:hypothetical protein